MSKNVCALIAAITLALALPAVSQAQPWTGTPAAAVIEPASQGAADITFSSLSHNSTSSAVITAYYNVTDTTATGNPSWNTIEVRYFDNATSDNFVRAALYQISSTGSWTSLSSCTSTESASPTQRQCTFTSGAVNFNAGYTYVVKVTLDRTVSTNSIVFYGVRIF